VAPPLEPERAHTHMPRRGPLRLDTDALWWPTLLVAGIACFVTFYAKGGLNLETMTTAEMALTLGAGVVVAGVVVLTPPGGRAYGLWPVGLLLAFTILTALSVVWSVQPDISSQDAGRMLAYSGVFGAAVVLVRLAPERWPAILGGLTLAAAVVCGYALLTKIFPGALAPTNTYARLEEPYEYWNATGLAAAMGAICCMWLGARRTGHALLSALAYPAMGLMLLTLMLAYSRGALAALAMGLALWFCLVPLRLRGAAVLIVGALGAGAVVAWDFSTHALSAEGVALGERVTAGHQLGALIVAMVLVLMLAGLAIGFLTSRRPPARAVRRQAGAILLGLIAIAIVAFAGALTHSHRGLTGSVSHAVDALTNPNAKPPPNTPGRLTAVASVRARYWKEALQVFDAHPTLGAGASGYQTASLHYRTAPLEVKNAHGFVVQTLADLGAVGFALALALLIAWMVAAGRCTHPFNRRWTDWRAWRDIRSGARPGWRRMDERELRRYTPERVGLLSMLCLVVVFGAHSFIDWTWYVPGDACVALLCAGWLAGRGPLRAAAAGRPPIGWLSRNRAAAVHGGVDITALPAGVAGLDGVEDRSSRTRIPAWRELSPVRACVACAAIIAALLAAWTQWQPQRSVDASQQALGLTAHDPKGALSAALTSVARDPLSAQALFTLSTIQQASGHTLLARATLQRAVRLQPSNPETWVRLGEYDLSSDPRSALNELSAAIYLNPESIAPELIAQGNEESITIQDDYIQALRATTQTAALNTVRRRSGKAASARGFSRRASTNAIVAPKPAAAAERARQPASRRRALRLLRSRSPRAGP
jgi:O-antigen ligase